MIVLKDLLLLPNLISLSRVALLVPWFYTYSNRMVIPTLTIVFLMMLSDFLDGILSRRMNQISDMGKIIDPLADKICLSSGLFYILYQADITLFPIIFLITRDVAILALGFAITRKKQEIPVSNMFGKLTSLSLATTGTVFIIFNFMPELAVLRTIGIALYCIFGFFLLASSVTYAMRAVKMLKKG